MRWEGHTACMEEMRNVCKILFKKPLRAIFECKKQKVTRGWRKKNAQ
jgi:hypothetical protein